MSNYNDRASKPVEKLTVAGVAAIIVVGVFVVCVILILAKSLFPSNNDSTPEGVYTGTKQQQTEAVSQADSVSDSAAQPTASAADSLLDSAADSLAVVESQADVTTSAASGETAVLNQNAYLRSGNGQDYDPLLTMNGGETVTVLERPADSEYVHVQYYDYEGWVWYGYIQ